MEILKKLKDQGWHLTEDGLKKVIEAETPGADIKKIIAAALDWDLREIGGGALPTKREDTLPGRIVLQVQKIRNIAAPKSNEESKVAPRFLQVDFTDGHTLLQGLELEPIAALSLNVPPGTKVYFRAERLQLMQGFVVLKAAELQVLGGKVEQMVEKWELARTMLKYARSGRRVSGSSGPPPWIAFGKKLEMKETLLTERNFKSLQAASDKDKEASKENEEFNAMRTEAIAEAAKTGARKVFGGGNQQILDHNVKKILEKGYSEEDAKQALRSTNNNLERALYNLKRRDSYKHSDDRTRSNDIDTAPTSMRGGRGGSTREMGGGRRGLASAKEEATAAKPASNVSLFDFLTEKLPANSETSATATAPSSTQQQPTVASSSTGSKYEKSKYDANKSSISTNTQKPLHNSATSSRPKFENNLSSSFAANRTPTGSRLGRGEREPYNPSERQSNTRYPNTSGRGGRGGRGGYQGSNRGSYEESGGSRSFQQRPAVVASETSSRHTNNSNYNANVNSNANNNNNRSNRGSHERSSAPAGGNEKPSNNEKKVASEKPNSNEKQPNATGGNDSRRSQDYQNKGHEKSRFNQKDGNSNRNYDNNNSNRQQSSSYSSGHNINSHSNNTATPAANNANNSDHAVRMNKLVESTSKMKIDRARDNGRNNQRAQNQRQQQYSQQQQPQPQMQPIMAQQYQNPTAASTQLLHQQVQPSFTQLPNGFSYDPSKIIGFQSKESNEYAMSLLKSQGLASAPSQAAAAQQQQQQQQAPPPPTHYVSSASPLQMPPQQPPSPFGAPAAIMLPAAQSAAAPSNAGGFGMQPGEGWLWKIGDLCLAKYWDDGRYYEAEITGISYRTCVVFFLGYGNHEEVLKSDCLPITDANHRPINQYTAGQQPHAPQQTPLPSMHVNSASQSRGVPNRYRGERQVYVPPPKREN